MRGLFDIIAREVRAGRSIPILHDRPAADLSITEGAVRALVGHTRFAGDLTVPGAPIRVAVSVTALRPLPLHELATRVRGAVDAALTRHTPLLVEAIDVSIDDIRSEPRTERE